MIVCTVCMLSMTSCTVARVVGASDSEVGTVIVTAPVYYSYPYGYYYYPGYYYRPTPPPPPRHHRPTPPPPPRGRRR